MGENAIHIQFNICVQALGEVIRLFWVKCCKYTEDLSYPPPPSWAIDIVESLKQCQILNGVK